MRFVFGSGTTGSRVFSARSRVAARSSQDQGRAADEPQGYPRPSPGPPPASLVRARKYLRPSVLRDRYAEVSPSSGP